MVINILESSANHDVAVKQTCLEDVLYISSPGPDPLPGPEERHRDPEVCYSVSHHRELSGKLLTETLKLHVNLYLLLLLLIF